MSYRDATASVAAEAVALRAERRAELTDLNPDTVGLFAHRSARLAFGATGFAGAVAVVFGLIYDVTNHGWILLGSWALALAAYVVARLLGPWRLRRLVARALAWSGDPYRDVAALRALDVNARALELATRDRHESYAWPLVAATLLGPHTLHLIVAVIFFDRGPMSDFDEWMQWTSAFTPHVFAYGAYAAWTFPRTRVLGRHVLIASLLSLIPGILLLGIPSFIVLLTATAVGLIAYLPTEQIIAREEITELTIRNALRE